MNYIKEGNIFEEVEAQSSSISYNDLGEIEVKEKKISVKASKLDVLKFKKLIRQVKLATRLIKDYQQKNYTDIPWRSIGLIAAAILYFLNPFDLVPDIFPIFGLTDDAIMFATVFKSIQYDLEKYCRWKKLDPEDYYLN